MNKIQEIMTAASGYFKVHGIQMNPIQHLRITSSGGATGDRLLPAREAGRRWQTVGNTHHSSRRMRRMFKTSLVSVAVGLLALGMVAAQPNDGLSKEGKPAARNIVQTAREAGSFTTLIKALEATDLIGTLSGQGHGKFTVFAPTDAAFAKLPAGTVESLLKHPDALKKILLYHVVAGEVLAADVLTRSSLPTLNGQDLPISTVGGVKVGDANVTTTNIRARNGVIHVIDMVLIPR